MPSDVKICNPLTTSFFEQFHYLYLGTPTVQQSQIVNMRFFTVAAVFVGVVFALPGPSPDIVNLVSKYLSQAYNAHRTESLKARSLTPFQESRDECVSKSCPVTPPLPTAYKLK